MLSHFGAYTKFRLASWTVKSNHELMGWRPAHAAAISLGKDKRGISLEPFIFFGTISVA
jgi:hypothetical protein